MNEESSNEQDLAAAKTIKMAAELLRSVNGSADTALQIAWRICDRHARLGRRQHEADMVRPQNQAATETAQQPAEHPDEYIVVRRRRRDSVHLYLTRLGRWTDSSSAAALYSKAVAVTLATFLPCRSLASVDNPVAVRLGDWQTECRRCKQLDMRIAPARQLAKDLFVVQRTGCGGQQQLLGGNSSWTDNIDAALICSAVEAQKLSQEQRQALNSGRAGAPHLAPLDAQERKQSVMLVNLVDLKYSLRAKSAILD